MLAISPIKQDLRLRYPGTSSSGLGLLRSMLRFNPSDRLSVDAALAHPYLASVRYSLPAMMIWIHRELLQKE